MHKSAVATVLSRDHVSVLAPDLPGKVAWIKESMAP